MALASFVARLREVLLQGPGAANNAAFAGGFSILTRPLGGEGVVIFPDANVTYSNLSLRGDPADVGLEISKVAPTIICTIDVVNDVTLQCTGGNSDTKFGVRWFRFQ